MKVQFTNDIPDLPFWGAQCKRSELPVATRWIPLHLTVNKYWHPCCAPYAQSFR